MEVIKVKLFGKELGFVWMEKGTVYFQYEDEFCDNKLQPSPVIMRKEKGKVFSFKEKEYENFRHLPPMVADSLPDKFGTDLLIQYLSVLGINEENLLPPERLSYIGERGLGALTYHPSKALSENDQTTINLEKIRLASDAVLNKNREKLNLPLTGKEEDIEALKVLYSLGGSAPGARAKVLVYRKGNHLLSAFIGNVPEGYRTELLKISGKETKDHGVTEYIYYLMACDAGVNMSPSSLIESNGYSHFTTQRFDRPVNGEKLHTQTLCGLTGLSHNLYAQGLEYMLELLQNYTGDFNQTEQMFTRMVFNIIAVNRDDHSKNTTFLMNQKGEWSLSPAYDLIFTYSHNVTKWSHQHHTSINNKVNHITIKDILACAQKFDIKEPRHIIEKVLHSVSDFEKLGREYGLPAEKINFVMEAMKVIKQELDLPLKVAVSEGRNKQ